MRQVSATSVLGHHILLRGCSVDVLPAALSSEAFVKRLVETTFANIDTTPVEAPSAGPSWQRFRRPDPVAVDLQQIPMVLGNIDANWSDK
eukprot:13545975-Heterocapsa_arctica.AAC.1